MDDKLFLGSVGHHYENSERKYPNGHRDVKRKLSFISKKIGDFQHQRKFLYKNSAKVKRIVHNQVNQIVKCLRARERSLWADVDEAYIAQDEYISEELLMLKSLHARCESLFQHFNDNKGAVDVLDKIYSTLSDAKFGEKQDVKALEFISDFESMKSMANDFGHLEGDFVKKDKFVFISKRETNSSDPDCQEFYDKNGCCEKLLPLTIVETENSKNDSNSTESEDSFEIVDLLDSMCCEENVKDSVMVEQENSENCCQEECIEYSSGNKIAKSVENSQKTLKSSNGFNPEEEWKQIFEIRNKIANFSGISSKLSEENKNYEIQSTASTTAECYDKNSKPITHLALKGAIISSIYDKNFSKEKLDKNYKQNKFSFLKETDSLLHRSSEKDTLNEKNFEKINAEINSDSSPAELIRQAFSSYFTKDSIHNWILRN